MITAVQEAERKRVLMLAYACSPYRGSEPGTGWHRAYESAKYFDTWVVCEKSEFEADIVRFETEHGAVSGLSFCFVLKTPLERLLGGIPGLYYMTYRRWHRRAYRTAAKLHERVRFDLVHQANMCGFREPGFLWKLPVPFVWGPIGGSQNYPWRFLSRAGFAGAIREASRSIVNRIQLRFSPHVRAAVNRAAVVMAANSENKRDFQRFHGVAPKLFLEIGTTAISRDGFRKKRSKELRLLWSGQLEHHKALHLLIEALARLPESVPYELRILGEGRLERRWKRLAQDRGIENRCQWLGFLPLREAFSQYDWADVFVFTSLRDTAGTVVLEALSRGLPVVCLDHQGAGDIVTVECGRKIPVTTPDRVVDDLAYALTDLAGNPDRLGDMSRHAVLRAESFLWERQGKRLAEIYEGVLQNAFSAGDDVVKRITSAEPGPVEVQGTRQGNRD